MVKIKHFAHIDFLSATAALSWALGAQFVPELQALVDFKIAFAFSGAAFLRWATAVRKEAKS